MPPVAWQHRYYPLSRIAIRQNWSVRPSRPERNFRLVRNSTRPGLFETSAPVTGIVNIPWFIMRVLAWGSPHHLLFTENMPQDAVIPPGAEVTLTLNLRAPFAAGRQVGYWKLRDPAGILFMPQNVDENASALILRSLELFIHSLIISVRRCGHLMARW